MFAQSFIDSDAARALPEFGLALVFLVTWIRPDWLGAVWLKSLLLILLAEMLLLAAGFAVWRIDAEGPGVLLVLLLTVYGLMMIGLARLFRSWWPVVALVLLLAGRWLSDGVALVFGGLPPDPPQLAVRGVALLAAVAVTTLTPLPRFGVSPGLSREVDLPGDGIWVDEPHRLLAAGLLYFLAAGLARLMGG